MSIAVTETNGTLLVEPSTTSINISDSRTNVVIQDTSKYVSIVNNISEVAVSPIVKSINVSAPSNDVIIQSNFNIGAVEALVKDLIPEVNDSGAVVKVEILVVQFDSIKQTHFITTSSQVEGDLISMTIFLDSESVEIFGNYNFIGNRVEFQTDFSAIGLNARVTYIKK